MSIMTNDLQPQSQAQLVRRGLLLFLLGLAIVTGYLVYRLRQPHYQVHVFETRGGWGYDIQTNNKTIIHQPSIPGVPGMIVFPNQEQALRVGNRVVEKIEQTKAVPTLTNEDLRQLGVKIP